ncbi:hypothetical protein F2P56_037025 [Juglans regia]|uniref:Uncharacterized protein n=1 Tax=Juglans regia TaxID=51240 RepID=A0A833TS58_JUGRE|nr:hypothetical protein F2P56_037025 [Juglans regia]
MRVRNLVVVLLFVTVIAPVVLYTDRLATFKTSSSTDEFTEDVTTIALNGHNQRLNVLPQESSTTLKEPIGIVYSENSTKSLQNSGDVPYNMLAFHLQHYQKKEVNAR